MGWGINPDFGGMRIYKTTLDQDPDFFIHSGDNIYADGPMLPSVTLPDGTVWKNAFLDEIPAKSKVAAGQPFARIMQISGFDYTSNPALPAGGRVLEVRRNGAPIDKTATYKVSCNNFMATGGDNFTVFLQGTNQVGGAIDLDALVDYVEDHSPIAGPIAGRIKNP